MIRFIFSIIFITGFCALSTAQSTTSDSLSTNHDDIQTFILKTRKLLVDKFNGNKLSDIKDILQYIDANVENSPYLTLNPPEKIMLLYRIGEYKRVFAFMEKMDKERSIRNSAKPDELTYLLIHYFGQNKETFYFDIDNADLSSEQKDFLKILLDNMLFDDGEYFVKERDLIQKGNQFLTAYPESPYAASVKTFCGDYELSPWSFSYSMCGGVISFTDDLNSFWDKGAYFELSLEASYKRLNAAVSLSGASQKAKEDKMVDGVEWKMGNRARWNAYDFQVGYAVIQSNKHNQKLVPFVMGGFMGVKATDSAIENNEALDDKKYDTFRYGVGLFYNYSFIRLKYTFIQPCFDSKYNLNGSGHSLSVGFVFSFQSFKRK